MQLAETVYMREYLYKPSGEACQPGSAATQVPLQSFVYSQGDTEHTITSIKSIVMATRIRRYNKSGSGREGWVCGIVLTNNRGTIYAPMKTADKVSMSSAKIVKTDPIQISEQLKLEDIQAIYSMPTGVDSSSAKVATQFGVYPLYVQYNYTSAQYFPSITKFETVRADANGTQNPRGLYCRLTLKYDIGNLAPQGTTVPASLTVSDGTRTQTVYNTRSTVESNRNSERTFLFMNGAEIAGGTTYTMTLTLTYGEETVQAQRVVPKNLAAFCYNNKCFSVGQFTSVPADYSGNGIFESDWRGRFYNGIEGVNVYSTGEIDTGGKWIDGKAIYRSMVTFSAAAGTNQIAQSGGSNIEIDGVDTVVRVDGVAQWSGDHIFVPINFYAGNSQYTAVWTVGSPAKIYYSTSAACAITLTLFYTKEE